ncbi:hypothetical protein PAPYR_13317 [Paratrimastix pyriformis]|uniref:Uncharacterized protein n=1 Tax=Paratrimastix pyriformis TaxID=342808 RepID=A0ABQ8U0F4_9EUKA|nr:hypothetical protein PAPYR_13317 [Paratrimastix pyriformis]
MINLPYEIEVLFFPASQNFLGWESLITFHLTLHFIRILSIHTHIQDISRSQLTSILTAQVVWCDEWDSGAEWCR